MVTHPVAADGGVHDRTTGTLTRRDDPSTDEPGTTVSLRGLAAALSGIVFLGVFASAFTNHGDDSTVHRVGASATSSTGVAAASPSSSDRADGRFLVGTSLPYPDDNGGTATITLKSARTVPQGGAYAYYLVLDFTITGTGTMPVSWESGDPGF